MLVMQMYLLNSVTYLPVGGRMDMMMDCLVLWSVGGDGHRNHLVWHRVVGDMLRYGCHHLVMVLVRYRVLLDRIQVPRR